MITDILFSTSIAIKEYLRHHPKITNKDEILKLVTDMERVRVNIELPPVITDSLAENEPVTFGEERPDDGVCILVLTSNSKENNYYLGYYFYTEHHTYPNELFRIDHKRFECFTDGAKWVKSTKTLEELNLEYVIR